MNRISMTGVFARWLRRLRDPRGKVAVLRRIERAEHGNFGDHKPVGEGVFEMRIKAGPGYRVYYTQIDGDVYLLLVGGNKSSQKTDIQAAYAIAAELRSQS